VADPLYKILPAEAWPPDAEAVPWAPVDHGDGFVHLSAEHQVRETAEKHFAGRHGLMVLKIDPDALGDALRWEPSRRGALFPHVYGDIPRAAVIAEAALPWGEDGFDFDHLNWVSGPAQRS
jgi:uncharacterized protein (DUF952 family)